MLFFWLSALHLKNDALFLSILYDKYLRCSKKIFKLNFKKWHDDDKTIQIYKTNGETIHVYFCPDAMSNGIDLENCNNQLDWLHTNKSLFTCTFCHGGIRILLSGNKALKYNTSILNWNSGNQAYFWYFEWRTRVKKLVSYETQ